MVKFICVVIILTFSKIGISDEIIRDRSGNYYLMKDDGSFKRLPPPKPGKKYIIKKKIKNYEDEIRSLKRNKPKSRFDTRSARKHLPGINAPEIQ